MGVPEAYQVVSMDLIVFHVASGAFQGVSNGFRYVTEVSVALQKRFRESLRVSRGVKERFSGGLKGFRNVLGNFRSDLDVSLRCQKYFRGIQQGYSWCGRLKTT